MASTSTPEELAVKLANQRAREKDATRAAQEYDEKRTATLVKTERLRAERLVREAEQAEAEAAAAAAAAAAPAAKRSRR